MPVAALACYQHKKFSPVTLKQTKGTFDVALSTCNLCLQDLTYKVTSNANSKLRLTLLHKVSGFLLPGHLSALVRLVILRQSCNISAV